MCPQTVPCNKFQLTILTILIANGNRDESGANDLLDSEFVGNICKSCLFHNVHNKSLLFHVPVYYFKELEDSSSIHILYKE